MNDIAKESSDRAALTFKGSIPDGLFGRDIEIEATPEGLEIECLVIPWVWIDSAKEKVRS